MPPPPGVAAVLLVRSPHSYVTAAIVPQFATTTAVKSSDAAATATVGVGSLIVASGRLSSMKLFLMLAMISD